MWMKSKFLLFGLSLQLLALSIFSLGGNVKAADKPFDGFIIKADKVEGSGMVATIVSQETSANDRKPMLRIHYEYAVIYGMSLTKEVDSPSGPVSITLKANGPVRVKGMTVDTTAISFQGACIKVAEIVPEIAMEKVVMVAHYMDSEESNIDQLLQNIISGKAKADGSRPSTLNLLQDLSKLPGKELDQEITKITSGHLPLMCDDEAAESGKKPFDSVKSPLDPVIKPLKPVTGGLDPVLEPVKKPLESVIKPIEPVTKPLEPLLKTLDPVTNPLKPVLKPLDPIISDPEKAVDQTLQLVCVNLKEANGEIKKELALKLIDEAIQKKQALTSICSDDGSETIWLQKWNDSLLKSSELLDLFGVLKPEDPLEQMQKIRDKVSKAKDGAIIFSP
jgi:hypothetical protein